MADAPTDASSSASRSVDEVARDLDVDLSAGLSAAQVHTRRLAHGRNALETDGEESLIKKFLEQFQNPLNMLLMASGGVSVLMGHLDDAISIVVALTIVVTVAFVQEYRSEKTLDALKELVPPRCRVIRDGFTQELDASELVPGDIILIATGDRVPADGRLVEAINLDVDESSLTGETHPVSKHTAPLQQALSHPIAERKNLVYMGTLVRTGHGKAIVYGTGRSTEFGAVFEVVDSVEERKTPLQARMDTLANQLSMASMAVIGVIVLVGALQGQPVFKMLQIGVSLAVAAIPEGLPICVTVTLALGVMRMASRHAILKKLPAVEALGCTSILCVDKTGTLTTNQMQALAVYVMNVAGAVWPLDTARSAAELVATTSLFLTGVLCNNADLVNGDVVGQATEGALLLAAASPEIGLLPLVRREYPRREEIPFSSDTKFMAVRVADQGDNTSTWHAKGMVEAILSRCTTVQTDRLETRVLSETDRQHLLAKAHTLAHEGLRVLALAKGPSMESLVFLGLVGISDPPRAGVADTIASLAATGVSTLMLTGDAKETAGAIALQVGILTDVENDDLFCAGAELDHLDESALQARLATTRVFYRTCPTHKLQIVRAAQAMGAQVAMTGDGVNDAPALKAADIGIAMGTTGTDVSKEAADMILLDDNLGTILYAMAEAKGIYHNITHFLRFQLSTSVAALSLIAITTLFGLPNPLNAMQILWINIIMDGPPAQSLGVEPVDDDVLQEGPRSPDVPIITRAMLKRVLVSASLIVLGTLYVFVDELDDAWHVSRRDHTMSFTTFVLFDMFNALSCRSETKSVFEIGLFSNKAFCAAVGASLVGQLMVIYVPFLQAAFQTEALSLGDLLYMTAIASSVLLVDEGRKWADARRGSWRRPRVFAKKKRSKSSEYVLAIQRDDDDDESATLGAKSVLSARRTDVIV
ncbi:calcium-transporting P-type ATPase, PMR1-type [Saprolegnia diclina VS20]|uniref:Calcium-transporting ATPase n=1 Tax=Saprolegnia diclina (strain VS20) TaxID=1156394 RepID=T0S383_SAPDV|nr:calcium-transporting P-type ATPase, PMR1-type [Saprolegnia diclina VS20]EQC39458.1 calcium-transporting P-type ATPase, PMR1-type [Saprolegnia diclina VS20]|eukprot:XP_008607519.1 calcium-transporting P-type ATPase, PMR1-type [Saprolegnia diclina VS20]